MSSIRKVMANFVRNTELDEFLRKEIGDAGYGGADILKTPVGTRITLFVTRPGIVIGRRGVGIRSLTENIGKKFDIVNPQISVLEIDEPDLYPQVMCNRIAHNVSRGTAFRRASLWALNAIMNAGALGAEISVSGKLRSERSHYEKHRAGIVPKSGDTAKRIVREATQSIQLKMGIYGIKVKIAIKDSIPPDIEIKQVKTVETDVKPDEIEHLPKEVVKPIVEKKVSKDVPVIQKQKESVSKTKEVVKPKLLQKTIKKSDVKVKLDDSKKDKISTKSTKKVLLKKEGTKK
ncbi:30S ribosomal protein S3 [Thermoproteota archaeon]